MAEDDSAQDKTEEATPKRLEKAREDGQVPRSKELTTSAVLILGTAGLALFGGHMADSLMEVFRFNFRIEREVMFDPALMLKQLGHSFFTALSALIPLFTVLAVAAILGPIALGGWLFSTKSLAPKPSRLNPVSGLKRMFSLKSLIELFKSIGKVLVVVFSAFITLRFFQDEILRLGLENLQSGVAHSLQISLWCAIFISMSTIFIALIDIPVQIWDHAKKLKMTMQEVKDEMKEVMGNPQLKGRMRQMQREMANQRMMESVPEADVVITNPTHYSVALRYDPETMETPVLLAKGVDYAAFRIRDLAKEHKIDLVRSPLLARAVYHTTEIDAPIPNGLYLAVAQVLAYVFQLRSYRRGQGEKPDFPRNITVPEDMIFPE